MANHLLYTTSRALMLLSLLALPLMAVNTVRAGDQNIIVSDHEMSSGAGLVLMVSLKRAH